MPRSHPLGLDPGCSSEQGWRRCPDGYRNPIQARKAWINARSGAFRLCSQPQARPADNGVMERGATLTLTCPRCGEGYPSAMQMDPLTFDAMRLESMIERCSVCAHAFRFEEG